MTGACALIEEAPETSLPASTLWGGSERAAVYEPGSGLSLDTKCAAGTLIWDFSASRTVRNNRLLLKHPVYGNLS